MKTIDTLVDDIYGLFSSDFVPLDVTLAEFGAKLSKKISDRIAEERGAPTLRLSNIGSKCLRQLWYYLNMPEAQEPLNPEVRMKFLFGDILEELLLFLAAEAGHTVEGMQDEVDLYGIKGHRDAIIDGVTVDTKSASSFSFKKFLKGLKEEDDNFGYLSQLSGYVEGGRNDPRVKDKEGGAFLVIDKTLGHICLDYHKFKFLGSSERIEYLKGVIDSGRPPKRSFETEPEGKSGNEKLGVNCSYCGFKYECYPRLRTFLYSTGPVYLTKVVREPNVPEVTPS